MVPSTGDRVLRLLSRVTCRTCDRTDAQLLRGFIRDHDNAAFEALLRRHAGLVWGVCRRTLGHDQDAEDVFQATFLVLARQAAKIRKPESLASWLHGTAHRMAQRARRGMARRHAHESQAARPAEVDGKSETGLRELQAVLDEEVQNLPENYRAAFTLCVLDGRSQHEAAAILGCERGTLAVHLCRARQRLKRQLVRRGVALSAVLTAAALAETASAAAPALVVRATLRALRGSASALSPAVAALVHGASGTLGGAKSKLLGILLLSATLAAIGAGTSAVLSQAPANAEPPPVSAAKPSSVARPEPVAEKEKTTEVRGRVLGPDDKPISAAKLYLVGPKRTSTEPLATSDADGKFHFVVKPEEVGPKGRVLATGAGLTPDWLDLARCEKTDITLRLRRDDIPFTGRVVTLEGQPVVGATVEAERLGKQATGDTLKPWVDNNVNLRKEHIWVNEQELLTVSPSAYGRRLTATTDKDGKFRLTGAGPDRVLSVRVFGEGIEYKFFWVVTRPDVPKDGFIRTGELNYGLYGPDLTVLVGPSKPLVGTIRDRATNKPIAGVMIRADGSDITTAYSDEKGQYRLDGVPKKKFYSLTAAGENGVPYLSKFEHPIEDTAGLTPIAVDFALDRGLEIKGLVVDKNTGQPIVGGEVHYEPTRDNPHLKDYPSTELTRIEISSRGRIAPDGTFAILAIPGPGVLSVCARPHDRYTLLNAERELRRLNVRSFPTDPVHAILVVSPDATKPESLVCKVELGVGKSRQGSVLGPDDKPVEGAQAAGLVPGEKPEPMKASTFTTTGLSERKRILLFIHPEKKLGNVTVLAGDSEEPLRVRIQPLGTIEGQVVDADGKPWAGLKVTCLPVVPAGDFDNLPNEMLAYQGVYGFRKGLWSDLIGRNTTTDKDGRFQLENIIPDLDFVVYVSDGDLAKELTLVAMRNGVRVDAGKIKDLGVLKKKADAAKE